MCSELLNSKRLKEGDRVLLRVVPWKVGMVVGLSSSVYLATETLETPSIPRRIFTLDGLYTSNMKISLETVV